MAKVEAVSVANSMSEEVVEAAWDRFNIDSAWGWLVDDPQLRDEGVGEGMDVKVGGDTEG